MSLVEGSGERPKGMPVGVYFSDNYLTLGRKPFVLTSVHFSCVSFRRPSCERWNNIE